MPLVVERAGVDASIDTVQRHRDALLACEQRVQVAVHPLVQRQVTGVGVPDPQPGDTQDGLRRADARHNSGAQAGPFGAGT